MMLSISAGSVAPLREERADKLLDDRIQFVGRHVKPGQVEAFETWLDESNFDDQGVAMTSLFDMMSERKSSQRGITDETN